MSLRYLSPIWIIAQNTYKEIIRDRLLYGILIVALLVTGSSFFLATVSLGQDSRVLQNVGLASIHLFALFICVFVATNSIAKDFERRALYLLFPKPIRRSQYVLGKYVGFILLLITTLAILGGLFSIGSVFTDRSLLSSAAINLSFSFIEISLLIALSVLFASFTAPLNAALYSIAFFIIGHSLLTLKDFVSKMNNQFLTGVITTCYYLLPNLEKFDVRRSVLYGLAIPLPQVGWTLIYWLMYTSLILGLAILVMKKREV